MTKEEYKKKRYEIELGWDKAYCDWARAKATAKEIYLASRETFKEAREKLENQYQKEV